MNYLPHASSPVFEDVGQRVAIIQGCHPKLQSRYKNDEPRFEVQFARMTNTGGMRWADWASEKVDAVLVSNLALRIDFKTRADGYVECSEFRVEFDPVGTIPYHLKWVKEMARTLTKLDKRASAHPREGSVVDAAIWIMDVCKALGVKEFARYDNDVARGDLDGAAFTFTREMNGILRALSSIAQIK